MSASATIPELKSQQQYKEERRQFWKAAYLATVASNNCITMEGPASWADRALREFDQRFDPEKE